jgi:hypothetical protein
MNSVSLESLKVSTRCGCNASARQMRLTAGWLSPLRLAIARVLQWAASRGFVPRVHRTTRSTCASEIFRGAPGRGLSSKPSRAVCARSEQLYDRLQHASAA